MEISGVHNKAFLHDWLVCFLYQTVLSKDKHDGKNIHEKFTQGYIVGT